MQKPLLFLAAAIPGLCLAQSAAPSKITQVLVYPGGASVERAARLAAGARELRLSCLPARFDIESLQVQADAGIQVGDISVQTLERARPSAPPARSMRASANWKNSKPRSAPTAARKNWCSAI
ncbi:MAG: DUF4140 domain-containing protein [Burkholderiales bacterium]|nr:DUF4140 domain-containing protein [Burkholderiales bacterium]